MHAPHIPELLAPAGGPAPFYAALAAGADAIYCGLAEFNARRGADNFTEEQFAEACRAAHVAGARVYVTENVVIKQEEMPAALELVRRAWELGADAFIIQDWGLLAQVRRLLPQVECHVSTQANVHDPRGVAWCRGLGATRVTLSRELALPEIAEISAQERAAEGGCELEVFGHGALCFCYSGVCLMSSMRALTQNVRSANRGLCAQPCRLPYDLVDVEGNVLSVPGRQKPLCPRDASSVDDLPALAESGADALKLEGRMKAPDYVHAVVAAYREALDALADGSYDVTSPQMDAVRDRLKRAFNRDFTNAYLHGTSGDEMMSYGRSNNRGKVVGEVISSCLLHPEVQRRGGKNGGRERGKKITPAEVLLRLDEPVFAGDLLEIRPEPDPDQFLTATVREDAAAGEQIEVRTPRPMQPGCCVRVIRSQAAFDAVAQVQGRAEAGQAVCQRPVLVCVVARQGEPFRVELATADGEAQAAAEGFVVEAARTRPVSREDLVEHVGRMGTSAFEPVSFEVELDEGCGMGFSAVHKVRAEACEALEQALLEPWQARGNVSLPADGLMASSAQPRVSSIPAREAEVCAQVTTPAAARAALAAGATRIYAEAAALAEHEGWPEDVVPVLSEVCRKDTRPLNDAQVIPGAPVAVGNVSHLAFAAERGAAPEVRSCIPIHNTHALDVLVQSGAAGVWLSPELTLDECCALGKASTVPVGLSVYGRPRVMTSEHCVLQVAGRCVHDCARCKLRQQELFLRDERGELMPVRTGLDGRSRIWLASPLDATPQVPELLASGVNRLLVDGTLLSDEQLARAVRRVVRAVEAARQGRRPDPREAGANSGHLFNGID